MVLRSRELVLQRLSRLCLQDSAVQRSCRRLLRNLFMFAMYARRWAGPGTPYPIIDADTRRLVGKHKDVSEELLRRSPEISAAGNVVLSHRRGGSGSNDVEFGKLVGMIDAHLYGIVNSVESIGDETVKTFLQNHLPLALVQPTTDESFWPSHELLWDVLFRDDKCVANQEVCSRQVSESLLATCTLLGRYLYKATPQWMVYEHTVDYIQ